MREGVKILVVDDEKALRHLLREFLETEGYGVEVAGGGLEALKLLARKRYPEVMVIMMTGLANPTP